VEAVVVAERAEDSERLRFHDGFAGGVVDHQMREIRLAGDRAERGEFGRGEAHEIERAGARVGT
jgi:hypothetical protein